MYKALILVVGLTAIPATTTIVANSNGPVTRKNNTEAIEYKLSKGLCELPDGIIYVSRGIKFANNSTLKGKGVGRTTIVNSEALNPFGDNCTLQLWPTDVGMGYADSGSVNGNIFTAIPGTPLERYKAKTLVWTWRWDGYTIEGVGITRARIHRIDSVNGSQLVLRNDPDPLANAIVWTTNAVQIRPPQEGDNKATAIEPFDMPIGHWIRITDGPTLADELIGEMRRITKIVGSDIYFDRPVTKNYKISSAVVLANPLENVTISDLTIAQPIQTQSIPVFISNNINFRFERVKIVGHIGAALSAYSNYQDCEIIGDLGTNGSHDQLVQNCRMQSISIEEDCRDLDYQNSIVSGGPSNGIVSNWYAPSERLRFRNILIENCVNMPLAVGGRQCQFRDIKSTDPKACWMGGDKIFVDNFVTNSDLIITGGNDFIMNNTRAQSIYLGWVRPDWTIDPAASPRGTYLNSKPLRFNYLTDEAKLVSAFIASPEATSLLGKQMTVQPKIDPKTKWGHREISPISKR